MVRVGVVVLVATVMAWGLAGEAVARPVFAQVPGSFAVTVKGVESGSVLNVVFNGRSERIRLIGVDVPDCVATEAYRRVAGLVYGRVAFLELDTVQRDDDDAVLGYVWIDNLMLNLRIAGDGYATAVSDGVNRRYDSDLRAAATRARNLGVGLWRSGVCE